MRPTDYVEMMMEDFLDIERESTLDTLFNIEEEMNYIHNCMEANSILVEKANPANKKEGFFTRIKNAISSLFSKFIEKAKRLVSDIMPMKKEFLDKLNQISYENIPIKAFPYWDVGMDKPFQDITAMYNVLKSALSGNQTEAPDFYKSPEEIVKNLKPFDKYKHESEGYQSVMRMKFSTGDNLDNYKEKEITDPATVKKLCMAASNFIQGYDAFITKIKGYVNSYQNTLKQLERIEKEKMKATKESFNPYLMLESATLSETDLKFCSDFNLVFEADGDNSNKSEPAKEEQKENPNKPTVGNVSEENGEFKAEITDGATLKYVTYLKNLCILVHKSLVVYMTVLEAKYFFYKSLVRQVVAKAEKNAKKNPAKDGEKETPKTDPNQPSVGEGDKENKPKEKEEAKKQKSSIKDKVKNAFSGKKNK